MDAAKNVDSHKVFSPDILLASNPTKSTPLTSVASTPFQCQISSSPPEIALPVVVPTEIGRTSCEKYVGFPVKQRRRGTILLDSPPMVRPVTGSNESYAAPGSALGSMTIIKSDNSSSNALHRERIRLDAAENQELSSLVEEQESGIDASETSSLICSMPTDSNLLSPLFTKESTLRSSEEGISQLEYSLDGDDDDDLEYNPSTPFLCAPPRNMRLELSAFGELWSLVAEWVTFKR